MYDHSYNIQTLNAQLRKGDFRLIPTVFREIFRELTVKKAVNAATLIFNGTNPISKFHLKKKSAYRIKNLSDDLVVRKLCQNLKVITKVSHSNRSDLIVNLCHFLKESVPYRIYRLDVKSFYESFKSDDIVKKTNELNRLAPLSKNHLSAILKFYDSIGGEGLPRGMALSAILSDFMMSIFDDNIYNSPNVYFYGRYVDDIVVVTNSNETQDEFIEFIKKSLPPGLQLNNSKTIIKTAPKHNRSNPEYLLDIDYLGYNLSVKESKSKDVFREVKVEIASSKVEKLKRRIIRSLIDFIKTKDENLLHDRFKYLTSNFSIYDKNNGKRILAGIYYSYPMLSKESESIKSLDNFIRNAVLSNKGRIFSQTSLILQQKLKRKLLSRSFKNGYCPEHFVHFSPTKINKIQECWMYE